MRALLQRVLAGSVTVDGAVTGCIGPGLVVFLGVGLGDTEADADYLAHRIAGLRVFAQGESAFDRSVTDVGGAILVVSQFTLYGDVAKGRRPSFTAAAPPDLARPLYEAVADALPPEPNLRLSTPMEPTTRRGPLYSPAAALRTSANGEPSLASSSTSSSTPIVRAHSSSVSSSRSDVGRSGPCHRHSSTSLTCDDLKRRTTSWRGFVR